MQSLANAMTKNLDFFYSVTNKVQGSSLSNHFPLLKYRAHLLQFVSKLVFIRISSISGISSTFHIQITLYVRSVFFDLFIKGEAFLFDIDFGQKCFKTFEEWNIKVGPVHCLCIATIWEILGFLNLHSCFRPCTKLKWRWLGTQFLHKQRTSVNPIRGNSILSKIFHPSIFIRKQCHQ
jgi:hypothetical protein